MIQDITQESFSLSEATLGRIDKLVPRYPKMRSAVLPLLHLIQDEKGYISDSAIEWVASRLEIEPINVYEVVTFYPMFRRHPIGRRHVKVCRTLSCALAGSYQLCDRFKEAFDCDLNEVSPDGAVTIEFVECQASCGTAPVVVVDETMHEKVDPTAADRIIAEIRAENPKN